MDRKEWRRTALKHNQIAYQKPQLAAYEIIVDSGQADVPSDNLEKKQIFVGNLFQTTNKFCRKFISNNKIVGNLSSKKSNLCQAFIFKQQKFKTASVLKS
jgi:hypothetical protein